MKMHATHLSCVLLLLASCGQKQDFEYGEELDPATLGGSGGGRTEGTVSTSTQTKTKAGKSYQIVPVTQIIEATSGIPGWSASDLPFTGASVSIGQAVTDGQTPFHFSFDYPDNNYQFLEAHLVIDTARDSSDTEAIFVDGVFSGRPPLSMVNTTSPKITDAIYYGSGVTTPNTYFIDWSLSHYKQATRNSFDLKVSDLAQGTSHTDLSLLKDGFLPVATGDDSPVYQAYLVIKGRTISSASLDCVTSQDYTFTNTFLHKDGNSTGSAAFTGTMGTPTTTATPGAFAAVEFHYDASLPQVKSEEVSLSTASINLKLKRSASGKAALVVNGRGVAETGFDRTQATTAVEAWDDAAVPAWESFLATVPQTSVLTTVSLDLKTIFGATVMRDLLAQGKLNIAVAGNLGVNSSGATTGRGFGTPISGPELAVSGTYHTEVCTVPDDPTSPLGENGLAAGSSDPETENEEVVLNDGAAPVINSVQTAQITSNSATIVWLTDEAATSKVMYGISAPDMGTETDTTLSTFHQVELKNLTPYKYYKFQVVSADRFGNESRSEIQVFVTQR
ncbi:MAG TPA: fibronectin type III domain-containing protein [Oligoflexus sp.]|uniref:fibronectin type III domain-containing protein n=1 Tax=Oligoflexus sp. TaxID=1971216 RepID=UPI002D7EADE0|nr:fibronectin type III domain-containing protein [Oligoflexus sp.]HET9240740.1 fibronectin type III domain-containing protein [Oligoflexus sp.]